MEKGRAASVNELTLVVVEKHSPELLRVRRVCPEPLWDYGVHVVEAVEDDEPIEELYGLVRLEINVWLPGHRV